MESQNEGGKQKKKSPKFPNMMKTIDPQIQEVQLTPSRKKKKENYTMSYYNQIAEN